jgi:hypothetical protein
MNQLSASQLRQLSTDPVFHIGDSLSISSAVTNVENRIGGQLAALRGGQVVHVVHHGGRNGKNRREALAPDDGVLAAKKEGVEQQIINNKAQKLCSCAFYNLLCTEA